MTGSGHVCCPDGEDDRWAAAFADLGRGDKLWAEVNVLCGGPGRVRLSVLGEHLLAMLMKSRLEAGGVGVRVL